MNKNVVEMLEEEGILNTILDLIDLGDNITAKNLLNKEDVEIITNEIIHELKEEK